MPNCRRLIHALWITLDGLTPFLRPESQLSGIGVTAKKQRHFEDDTNFQSLVLDPFLQLHQLAMQPLELLVVVLALQFFIVFRTVILLFFLSASSHDLSRFSVWYSAVNWTCIDIF